MDARIYSEKTINSIRSHLEKNESKFITYPKFVFLCGKAIRLFMKNMTLTNATGIF